MTEGSSPVMVSIFIEQGGEKTGSNQGNALLRSAGRGDYGAAADSSDVIAIGIPVDFDTDEIQKRMPILITDDTRRKHASLGVS